MKTKSLPLLLVAALHGLAVANPNLIVLDPFDDGGRTAGADPSDINWWRAGNNSSGGVTSGADSVINGDNSLVLNSADFAGYYGILPSVITLDAIGSGKEGLRLTFDFRVRSFNTNVQGFRFGLVNQLGTVFSADNALGNADSDDVGFIATAPIDATGGFLRIRSDQNKILHSLASISGPFGVNGSVATSSPDEFNLTNSIARSGILTVVRDGDGTTLSVSASIYEEPGLQGAVLATASTTAYTPPSIHFFTFDTIAFGVGAAANNYSFDNVKLVQFPGVEGNTSLYADWAATFVNFTDTDPGSDPEFDGVKNLLEYVLGGDPTASDPGILPQPALSGSGDLTMDFRRRIESIDAGVDLVLQISEALDDWTTATEVEIGPTSGTGPDGITYNVTVDPLDAAFHLISITAPPGTAPRKFARLSATLPPISN